MSEGLRRDRGPGHVERVPGLPRDRLEAVLAAHDAALAAGDARVAKVGPRSRVTVHGDLAVKERRGGWTVRLRDALWPRRRRAGVRGTAALEAAGVATAPVRAFVRRVGRTFTVLEDLSAHPRLDLHAATLYGASDREAQVALRDAVARWLAGLHARGVYHGDLKGVNVRVDRREGEPRLLLIDADAVRVGRRPVGARRRVKNLAQLAGSIARVVSRAERLRFHRRYAAALPEGSDERATAAAVARILARRIVVRDRPIE